MATSGARERCSRADRRRKRAARAGSLGDGFEVVAQEVKDLAREVSRVATDLEQSAGPLRDAVRRFAI